MPRTSLTVYPNNWRIYDEPYAGMGWTEQGSSGQSTLENYDSDFLVSTNTSGLAMDSESAEGYSLRTNDGSMPTFPADARNASVEIAVIGKSNTGTARIAGGYVNTANGKYASSSSFANLTTSNAYHTKAMDNGDGDNVFAALAADQYVIRMLYASRPDTDGSTSCYLDQYQMTVTYDYGPDDVPDPFNFTDNAAPASTAVASNIVTISGTTPGTPLSASFTSDGGGMTALVNGANSYGPNTPFTVYNGDTIQMRGTTPATVGYKYNATVTINGVSDAWAILAGTDVPQTVTPPPGPMTGAIPDTWYPNSNYGPAYITQNYWQIYNTTTPMKFHLVEDDCEWALSNTGPWTTGTTEGELPATPSYTRQIYFRAKSAKNPSESRTVTLIYSSQNLSSAFTMVNGNEATIHYVDLSPIQASQEAVPGYAATAWYSPTPSGSMNHFTVSTKVAATSATAGYQAMVNGEWWRLKSNGALPVWPVGTKILGVSHGTSTDTSTQGSSGVINLQFWAKHADAGTMTAYLGAYDILNSGNLTSRNVYWMPGGAAPTSAIPTSFTQQTLDAAIKADTYKWCTNGYISTNNQLVTGCVYKLLRVYFQITKPPEGMAWEA